MVCQWPGLRIFGCHTLMLGSFQQHLFVVEMKNTKVLLKQLWRREKILSKFSAFHHTTAFNLWKRFWIPCWITSQVLNLNKDPYLTYEKTLRCNWTLSCLRSKEKTHYPKLEIVRDLTPLLVLKFLLLNIILFWIAKVLHIILEARNVDYRRQVVSRRQL